MMKPINYDEEQAIQLGGSFETLPAGNYKCVITKAEEGLTKTDRQKLTLFLDIAEGEFTGFFNRQYKADTRPEKKWGCQFVQLVDGTSTKFFKGMITAIEQSNKGYTFNFDEKTLTGKFVGGCFGIEEYRNGQGELKEICKCRFLRSLDKMDDKVLEPKRLQETNAQYDPRLGVGYTTIPEPDDSLDLPF